MFEEYIRNERIDRYNLIWSSDSHGKQQLSSVDASRSGGCKSLPPNSTTEALVSLSATIYLIDYWLKCLEDSSLKRYNMYFETME